MCAGHRSRRAGSAHKSCRGPTCRMRMKRSRIAASLHAESPVFWVDAPHPHKHAGCYPEPAAPTRGARRWRMTSSRRAFLSLAASSAGASPLTARPSGAAELPQGRISPMDGVRREKIKITGLKVISLGYRLKPEEEWPDGDDNVIIYKTESVIVELTTDVGLKGIGGASRYNAPAQMKEYAEAVVKPAILGKNPFDVEYLAAGLCGPRARGVWAGVDTAMWDIIGKAKELPLYKILATTPSPSRTSACTPRAASSPGRRAPASWDRTTW